MDRSKKTADIEEGGVKNPEKTVVNFYGISWTFSNSIQFIVDKMAMI